MSKRNVILSSGYMTTVASIYPGEDSTTLKTATGEILVLPTVSPNMDRVRIGDSVRIEIEVTRTEDA